MSPVPGPSGCAFTVDTRVVRQKSQRHWQRLCLGLLREVRGDLRSVLLQRLLSEWPRLGSLRSGRHQARSRWAPGGGFRLSVERVEWFDE